MRSIDLPTKIFISIAIGIIVGILIGNHYEAPVFYKYDKLIPEELYLKLKTENSKNLFEASEFNKSLAYQGGLVTAAVTLISLVLLSKKKQN
jgi:hypothetical protein